MKNTIPEETKQCYLRVRTLFQNLVGAHPRITEICFGEGDDETLAELREELDNLADHLGVAYALQPEPPKTTVYAVLWGTHLEGLFGTREQAKAYRDNRWEDHTGVTIKEYEL